ncbi:MAG: hypothetical protein QOG00_1346 [Pyrinomonadaceae bacterium]|nr:hypothetical protein [Pyrinomonadaceae bacterium]
MGNALLSLIASGGVGVDVMLAAYLDESGHSADSRIVAMGGIMGNHLHMETLADRWREMLHRHRVGVFHMSELESSLGEFKGWTKIQREALLADALLCLKDLWIMPFGAVVIVEQYRELPSIAQLAFIDPWFICFQMCVREAAGALMWHRDDPSPADKIVLFHDRQLEYQGRAVSAFHFLKDSTSYGHRLGSITSASTSDFIQLQVADLVAYEIRKLVENAIYHPEIRTRWPMRKFQEMLLLLNYLDFTGRVPDLEGGALSMFRRSTFVINGGEVGMVGWPVKWPETPDKPD